MSDEREKGKFVIEKIDVDRIANKDGKFFHGKAQELQTICETHRALFRELNKDPEKNADAIAVLYLAYVMGKKMSNKLRQYKHNYDDGWWERHRLDGDEITKVD